MSANRQANYVILNVQVGVIQSRIAAVFAGSTICHVAKSAHMKLYNHLSECISLIHTQNR